MRNSWGYLRVRKKLWLAPLLVVLIIVVGLVLAAAAGPAMPFLYTIF